ncbi:MAG: helix-turn-helix transcriptional regulator [Candidatus Tectomicrobia bacterium]|uniref:Helix-turn-helix transcriptional regulator n=1 Tax=Tectimicrobiota bacterium TaxID=2528274 RepID=A0A933GM43_UNCTE|nr:helix-turn-helix transcriptional regulator [Candidatus Tectomicrobia bacterium]
MPLRNEPLFMISVVSQMLSIHPQTLRMYERAGFVQPSRTEGNTRLYSEEDVDRVRMILRLTRDLGVNLAGVEVILSMREKIDEMKQKIEALETFIQEESEENGLNAEEIIKNFSRKQKNTLIKSSPSKIVRLEVEKE